MASTARRADVLDRAQAEADGVAVGREVEVGLR